MNQNFSYHMPTKIVFGNNELKNIAHYINGRKTLLVTSKGFVQRGLVDTIQSLCDTIVAVFTDVKSHPEFKDLENGYTQIHTNDFELIVAIGGGSVLDASKYFSVYNDSKEVSFVTNLIKNQTGTKEYKLIPIISVPTTAGTGSEITPWATIWDMDEKKKYSLHLPELFSEIALYDPNLTLSVPKDITIQTGLDTLSHALESIWNKNATPITINYAIKSAKLIMEFLPQLSENLDNLEFRTKIMFACMYAGLAFSNTQTAIAHAMSYYITAHKGVPHGIACSFTLPMLIDNVIGKYEFIDKALIEIFGTTSSKKLKEFINQLNISTNFTDYGIDSDEFEILKESLLTTQRSSNSLINLDKGFSFQRYKIVNNVTNLYASFQLLAEKTMRKSSIQKSKIYTLENKIKYTQKLTFRVFDFRVLLFDSITLVGNTDALIYENSLFHQELLDIQPHHALKNKGIFIEFNRSKKEYIRVYTRSQIVYDSPDLLHISLLKEHSTNYYHFITENLPRLLLILDLLKTEEYNYLIRKFKLNIFIDSQMPQQCIEIIKLLVPFQYTITHIEKSQKVICSNLIHCGPLWKSLDNISGHLNQEDFFVDTYAIKRVYNALNNNISHKKKSPHRRLYLKRSSPQRRTITNLTEVEQYARDNNFEIIDTSRLSFNEQLSIFQEARIIIGATGAYFTNILWMQPNTHAIIFYPVHASLTHGIFQPLADIAKVHLTYFNVEPVETTSKFNQTVHSDFYVDLTRLTNLLKSDEYDI